MEWVGPPKTVVMVRVVRVVAVVGVVRVIMVVYFCSNHNLLNGNIRLSKAGLESMPMTNVAFKV